MQAQPTPAQPLTDLLTSILIFATRMLRDIHRHVRANDVLQTIFAAREAGARITRAIRLATLLLRRIQLHGLLPFAPPRPRPAPATPATPRAQPRLQTSNGDAAFIRRPIPIIVAAITRELLLAARAMGTPLPESLQNLCLHATLATTGLDTPEAPTPPDHPPPPAPIPPCPGFSGQTPGSTPGPTPGSTPAPTKTLEL